jgi:PAS domain S-box-containing protein
MSDDIDDTEIIQKPFYRRTIAQVMVLLNGLILTGLLFYFSSTFITRMVKDEYDQALQSTQKLVVEKLQNTDALLQSFRTILEVSDLNSISTVLQNIKSQQKMLDQFDQIIWMPVDNPLNTIPFKNTVAQSNFYMIDVAKPLPTLIEQIYRHKIEPVFMIEARGITKSITLQTSPELRIKPILIVSPVLKSNQPVGYLIAFLRLDQIIPLQSLQSQQGVINLSLRSNDFNDEFLSFSSQIAVNTQQQLNKDEVIKFAGSELSLKYVLDKGNKNFMLEIMPWVILFSGLTITAIMFLYITNNMMKSAELKTINNMLSDKNEALNAQVRERERLNQNLRKSEREHRAIINGITDIIFEVDPDGKILFLNDSWAKITGLERAASIGQNLFDMIHGADQQEQKQNMMALVRGQKQAFRVPTRLKTSNDKWRSVEMAFSMLRQDESRNLRVVGSFTDIEERQKAQQALLDAERKYRTIWENAAGGIYQLSTEGNFLSANPSMARILGYNDIDHLMTTLQNAHQDLFVQKNERVQFLRNLKPNSDPQIYEAEVYRFDRSKIWVRENVRAAADTHGNVLYFEGSMEDITARKEAEIRLSEAKIQSDSANRAKTEFLANMSHELRTPLNSIIGFSEIIKNQSFGPIQPSQYLEYASDIYSSGKNLLSIINQILDIARIDAGERELNEALVNTNALMISCLDLSKPRAEAAGLSLIDLTPKGLPSLIAEEVAVKQMLINLLSNAIKFTPQGGRVTLNGELESSGSIRLSVTDTGVGLSDEEIQKATSAFGVLDGRLDRATSGIGMGLSLVNALLKLHGGKLEIFSQKGIGTTASLIFPPSRVQR